MLRRRSRSFGQHARVLRRDGTGGPFTLEGRGPLELVVGWLDKILATKSLSRKARKTMRPCSTPTPASTCCSRMW